MKSEMSDTLEINVEKARKAVGSLFDKEDRMLDAEEEEEIVSGYDRSFKDQVQVKDLHGENFEGEDFEGGDFENEIYDNENFGNENFDIDFFGDSKTRDEDFEDDTLAYGEKEFEGIEPENREPEDWEPGHNESEDMEYDKGSGYSEDGRSGYKEPAEKKSVPIEFGDKKFEDRKFEDRRYGDKKPSEIEFGDKKFGYRRTVDKTDDNDNNVDRRRDAEVEPLPEIKPEKPWPEDEWEDEPVIRRKMQSGVVPPPKPAVKVNASVPAASRAPLRPKKVKEDDEKQKVEPPPKARAVKSRYLIVDDEDEYTDFRQRYKDRASKREEPPAKVSPSGGRPKTRRKKPPEYEEEVRYAPEPRNTANLPGPIRLVAVGFMVMLLLMMTFLIYRNSVIGGELEGVNERLVGAEQELSETLMELEAAREGLRVAQSEIMRLTAVATGNYVADWPYNGYYYAYYTGGYYRADTLETPATPGTDRVHTIAVGDNLYRISTLFYGNGSQYNIQRIMAANNITNPDALQVGSQLMIPY